MASSCLTFHVQRSQDDFQAVKRFRSQKNWGASDPKVYLRLFQTLLNTTAKVSRPYVKKDRLWVRTAHQENGVPPTRFGFDHFRTYFSLSKKQLIDSVMPLGAVAEASIPGSK
jgi:hypothetical protein